MNRDCYTFERRPVKLVHFMVFLDVRNAIDCEKMLKDWSKKKKEALIRGDRNALKLLSMKKFPPRCKRRVRTVIGTLQWAVWEALWSHMERF